jgi:molybdopterin/thiamine biosynthesis adenylyltransferase
MSSPELEQRFARQIILPEVGVAGQKKWAEASLLLAGEGVALESARTALESAGLSQLIPWNLDSSAPLPASSLTLVVTEGASLRREISRRLRREARPTLFAWASGSGFALYFSRHSGRGCPCLECFEAMNPKAFAHSQSPVQRLLGAMAASEALLWILKGETPLEGKVWMASLEEGLSFRHEVQASPKCQARLLAENLPVTP